MFCNKCGNQIDDNAVVCPNCGNPTNAQGVQVVVQQTQAPKQTNGCAIAGLVLAFFMPLIGLILSIVGLAKVKSCGGEGKGLAIAGLVLSILFIVLYIVIVYFFLLPIIF